MDKISYFICPSYKFESEERYQEIEYVNKLIKKEEEEEGENRKENNNIEFQEDY